MCLRNRESYLTMFFKLKLLFSKSNIKFNNESYDVHILLFDAVSMSHLTRALPLTSKFLREKMGAITFPYLNKVGFNTRPNAYALLMGNCLILLNLN